MSEAAQAPMPLVERAVRAALATVPDPEIPSCSVLDLGMLHRIEHHDMRVEVVLLPTFAGCPALDVIRHDAVAALRRALPGYETEVRFSFEEPWTSDRITPDAWEQMRALGIAPPGASAGPVLVALGRPMPAGPCPYCSSEDTEAAGGFGPTPCRAVAYCRACRNPFERFKPKR